MILWSIFVGLVLGQDGGITDLSWSFNRTDGATIRFFATIPTAENFKVSLNFKHIVPTNFLQNLNQAYDDCIDRNMSLLTISTEEEQVEVYKKINAHLAQAPWNGPPVAYWISLKRGPGETGDKVLYNYEQFCLPFF